MILDALVPFVNVSNMCDVNWEESVGDGEVRLVNVEVTEGDCGQVEEDCVDHQSQGKQPSIDLESKSLIRYLIGKQC